MTSYYEQVFFAQEEAAKKWIQMLDKYGEKYVLDSLIDLYWYPCMHEERDADSSGAGDSKYSCDLDSDGYHVAMLSFNTMIPYIGVQVEVNIKK